MNHPVALTLARGPIAEPVVVRVVRVIAARADLPIDRLEDAAMATAELVAFALSLHDRVDLRLQRIGTSLEVAVDDPGDVLAGALHAGRGEWAVVRSVISDAVPLDDDGRRWLVVRVDPDAPAAM